MAAAARNLTADQGATFRLAVRWLTPDRQPVDLTGKSAALELLPRTRGAAPTQTHPANPLTSDGWVTVVIPDEITQAWPVGALAYRLVVEPTGARDYLVVGRFDVRTPADV